jgi:hypothetical protein
MRLRTRLLTSAAVAGTLVLPLVPGAPAGAAPDSADDAVAWIETQQEVDGGFEVANFAGFETSDAIYAIAAAGQASTTWNEEDALAAVTAVTTEGGKDPLDAVDDWVDTVQGGTDVAAKAQQAAKVIVLVAHPLGLDETDFDPSGDTEAPVDLLAALEAGAGTGNYSALTFGGRAYAAWALGALGETVPQALLDGLVAGQQANGSFDFTGDPGGSGYDNDLTAQVILGLVVGGVDPTSTPIDKAVTALGLQQRWNGEWSGVGDDGSPNSTGLVMLAAAALGSDPEDACWRNRGDIRLSGVPYGSPAEAMEARQASDGHIVGPYDGFGLNTSGTSQAVQGLAASADRARYQGDSCTATEATGNRRTVHALYVDLLVRLADAGGADYWTEQFDDGMRPALLAKRFTGSPEYAGRVVERLYQQLLGRSASPGERQYYAGLITTGRREAVIARLAASPEYYAGTTFEGDPTPETWANAVFPDLLGRPATIDEVQIVTAMLQDGSTRGQLASTFVRSAAARDLLVKEIYRQLLRRDPASADLTYWRGELFRGVSPERLVTLIAGSAEYRASTQD